MTDCELLELAAKAACLEYTKTEDHDRLLVRGDDKLRRPWNPLENDGDALRLAVNLKLDVSFGNRYYFDEVPMTFCGTYWSSGESATFKRLVLHGDDPCAATRRAIVRAAAEVGKEMK